MKISINCLVISYRYLTVKSVSVNRIRSCLCPRCNRSNSSRLIKENKKNFQENLLTFQPLFGDF
jgi:hypothetical protein